MGIATKGFNDLAANLEQLAQMADGEKLAVGVLNAGAEILKDRMIANATQDPHPRSGALRSAVKIGNAKRNKGRTSVPVGVWSKDVPYAPYVEYGHGGPHPAPPHPFIRPAYDEGKDTAYAAVREALNDALANNIN